MEVSAGGPSIVPAVDSRHIPERLPAGPDDSSAPGLVAPSRYADAETESFYFVSPGGNYECAIRLTRSGLAGCHGPFPPDAPAVRSAVQEELVRPNSIEVTADGVGTFFSSGDPQFHRFDGVAEVLPYDLHLVVDGFECSIAPTETVSCSTAAEHGFAISADSYRLW